ncbi:MAG: DUF4856 domain-containing protein [Bacteroidetes bacterium]|nr:DUF4856 domain-containing protein [Bacteroidota bacterium]
MKISTLSRLFVFVLFSISILSCEKEDDKMNPDYTIPSTYDFEHVDYSGQSTRLAMMGEIKAYLSSAQEEGVSLDADRLEAMYSNDAVNAQWSQTYDDSKQLKSKTFESEQETFSQLLSMAANASTSTEPAANGTAGRLSNADESKTYLLNANGLEPTQLIEKGLMGACFYYQSTAVYFGDDKMNVDNKEVEPGKGTSMEHHWDEAFGYFGVPTDFPISTDGLVYWGKYSNSRNAVLDCNQTIMDAFIEGRAAISNDDLNTRDEMIEIIRSEWELIAVGSAIHYLNTAAESNDFAIQAHVLSEAIGFIYALQFNPSKKIDNTTVGNLLTDLAGSANFEEMNLYDLSPAVILQVRDQLASLYELESVKESL